MEKHLLADLEKNELVDLYFQMLVIRRLEEKAAEMYSLGKIGGFLHLYIGQEAVAVGAISVLRPDDYIIASYRDHGHAIARGCDPKAVMAELFGKPTGVSKGKGGSMHMFDARRNFMGGHAIVGGHLPVAAGIGYGIRYKKGDQVILCFFGEGASNIGAFHESLNVAALWKLPVVFICENNKYGMGTPLSRASASRTIAEKACAYDMPYEQVDGMDVITVRENVEEAVKRARQDGTPTLLEALTYRFRGHSMSDPARYRTRQEVEEQRERDPILLYRQKLEAEGVLEGSEIKELDAKAKRIAQEAAEFAENTPDPPLESLFEDVYASE
ncbi:MAG: pyruvate dehydrogenase (acetyl-transferring) E1 component subunit alpha [Candidatus Tectomicrobia bacterium]|uniref:Pyruvate dehydrogenase E1 component subunit alpha n=1 Tax=Tectimicrobiota bacterium TaxID=2528274 RepID=A0A932GMW8_UNCTE|nr:pyruvate dehydrogenase (acetyl-transferring) E1 component subunit alpha [Candidatus Tectomicrobia bacterium]